MGLWMLSNNAILSSESFENKNETINKINADPNILSSSQFEKAKHLSTKDAFPQIFGDKWQEAFKVYDKYFQANHLQQIKLMPAAKDFLELLLTNQIPMSIVSNKEGLYLRKEVEEFQLNKYFYNIIFFLLNDFFKILFKIFVQNTSTVKRSSTGTSSQIGRASCRERV